MPHTPGPWKASDWKYANSTVKRVIQNENDAICEVLDLWCMDDRTPERDANAILIAAAPEMLNALAIAQATIQRLSTQHGPFNSAQGTLDLIDAAMHKAGGNPYEDQDDTGKGEPTK